MQSGRILEISQSNVERQPGAPLGAGDQAWANWSDQSASGADAMKAPARRGRFAVIAVPVRVAARLLPAPVPGRRARSASPRWSDDDQGHRLLARTARLPSRQARQLPVAGAGRPLSAHLCVEPALRGGDDRAVPGNRLPVRLLHGARARSLQPALLMLVMLPFWTSFLLRVYAWKALLTEQGPRRSDRGSASTGRSPRWA